MCVNLRVGVWDKGSRANSLDLLRRSLNLHSCPINVYASAACVMCVSTGDWNDTEMMRFGRREQAIIDLRLVIWQTNDMTEVGKRSNAVNKGLCWGCQGKLGTSYLSFGAKCVFNPASCVPLGETDPQQPCDPAVIPCLLSQKMTPVSRDLLEI